MKEIDLTDRLGPYVLKKRLVAKNGLELWVGEDAEDRVFWVQTIVLSGRECQFKTEEKDLENNNEDQAYALGQSRQKSIAKVTAETISMSHAPMVHSHGGVTTKEGNRLLFWAMDVTETPPFGALGEPDYFVEPTQWLNALRFLFSKLKEAHEEGYCFGHLDLEWLIPAGSGELTGIAGLSIPIESGWLEDGSASGNWAPEEDSKTLPSGDFWRLGTCMARTIRADWPEPLHEMTAKLTSDNPAEREPNVEAWMARIDAAEASLTPMNSQNDWVPQKSPRLNSTKNERARDPNEEALGDKQSVPATEEATSESSSAENEISETVEQKSRSAVPSELIGEDESSTGNSARAALEQDPSEAMTTSTSYDAVQSPGASEDPEALDPEAAAWASPDLPAGASPWSEVVSAQGTHQKHSASDFPGFAEELPKELELQEEQTQGGNRAEEPLSDPELDFVVSGFSSQKIAIGIAALIVIFGGFFLLLQEPPEEEAVRQQTWTVSRLNEVIIDSTPRQALVVAEQDGAKLGQTPQRFLAPGDHYSSILLWAPGYEAQSIIIPDRGRVNVTLNPLPAGSNCKVRLQSSSNAQFESIGENLGSPPNYSINGTSIVRASAGQQMEGARLIRCPNLGGSSAQVLNFDPKLDVQMMRVTSPMKAQLYVSGSKQGSIPREINSSRAFVRLTAETPSGSESWWVPVEEGAEIQLPEPKSRQNNSGAN